MHYRAGDYIFVLIPEIAKYEWHPFTISSAPEQAGNSDFYIIFTLSITII